MSSKQKTTSAGSSQQTNTQGADPRLDPYWMALFGDVNKARESVDRSPLSGPAVAGNNANDMLAGINATQLGGMGDMRTMLQGIGAKIQPGTFTNTALDAASGRMLDPATNPTLNPMIDAAIRPITERLNREVIP